MTELNKRPVTTGTLAGSMIIAGTAIGAGMLANPTATSGLWFLGSVLLLAYVWFCMCMSGLMLLEVNLGFAPGASFHSMVSQLLGRTWNLVSGVSIVFVLYSLTYAYIYVGGGLTQEAFHAVAEWAAWDWLMLERKQAACLFLLALAACVTSSTRWVGYLSTLLIAGMLGSFFLATGSLLGQAKWAVLLNREAGQSSIYWQFALFALPVCLASFGFHGNVPSLVLYYRQDRRRVARSIIQGSLLALILYVVWQVAVQGNLPRSEFASVIAADGDVTVLLQSLSAHVDTSGSGIVLTAFAYMAIASSFLGVTLGLFDYLRDLCGWPHSLCGRTKTALLTFAPPLLAYLVMPTGFVRVMGYVGLMAAIWAVLVPALLLRASRKKFPRQQPIVPGGHWMIGFVILFAVLVLVAQILLLAGWLPVYQG
ncbi:MAG: aromatic amino acid transporter [Thiopseudomonas sp.]|jgi:tryptophan-specific transport protein